MELYNVLLKLPTLAGLNWVTKGFFFPSGKIKRVYGCYVFSLKWRDAGDLGEENIHIEISTTNQMHRY